MTNAIEHQTSGRAITVRAGLGDDGRVRATVSDRGSWIVPAREPRRGRGLGITAQLVDNLTLVPSDLGTLASIEQTLLRPARMIGAVARPAALRTDEKPLVIEDLPGDDETRVCVGGAVDASTAEQLTRDLLRRSRGGTAGLTVDLSGVTHLSSAGVAALFRVVARHEEQKAPLALHAVPGTVAQHILDLVALPYTATAPPAHF
jgi:anti-anti-sigma regulatory factor